MMVCGITMISREAAKSAKQLTVLLRRQEPNAMLRCTVLGSCLRRSTTTHFAPPREPKICSHPSGHQQVFGVT